MIIRKERRLSTLIVLITLLGTAAYIGIYIDSPPHGLYLLPVVAAFLVAMVTGRILNERSIILVCSGELSIKHAPVPWPGKTIGVHDIQQIYCAERFHSGNDNEPSYYTYDLKLLTTGGRRHNLAAKFRNKQSAHAIEKKIEDFLGIEHQEVEPTTGETYKASTSFARQLVKPGIVVLVGGWFVFRNNATHHEAASTSSNQRQSQVNGQSNSPSSQSQPQANRSTTPERSSAQSTAAYIAGVKAQVAFDELRGSRWIQLQDRPSALPDDELVIEFRSDDTGSIQVASGSKTLLDTEMTYQVMEGGMGEEILISFPNRSEIRARVNISADASAMKLHSPRPSDRPAKLLSRYFQWHLPFERDEEFVESSSEPTQASGIGPTSTEPASGEAQAEADDSEPTSL